METNLKNKNVVITGAAQGIGRACALEFASRGANMALIDINKDRLEKTVVELEQQGLKAKGYVCDITSDRDISKSIAQIILDYGSIHILVNNAGILRDSTLLKMEEAAFDQVLNVHLKGTFLLGKAITSHWVSEKIEGCMVNLSSVAYRGNFGQSNYSAAKAGIVGLTKTWAKELSKYNIRVNAVAPGLIETDMTAGIPEDIKSKLCKQIPLGRMGKAEEVAKLIAFLSGPGAGYIQGELIGINGGFLM